MMVEDIPKKRMFHQLKYVYVNHQVLTRTRSR
jgi:hypothetical protein